MRCDRYASHHCNAVGGNAEQQVNKSARSEQELPLEVEKLVVGRSLPVRNCGQ